MVFLFSVKTIGKNNKHNPDDAAQPICQNNKLIRTINRCGVFERKHNGKAKKNTHDERDIFEYGQKPVIQSQTAFVRAFFGNLQTHFIHTKQNRGEQKRDDIVNHPKNENGRKNNTHRHLMGEVDNNHFQNTHAARNVRQDDSNLRKQIIREKFKKIQSTVRRQKHEQTCGGNNQIKSGNNSLGNGYGQGRQCEFFFKNMKRTSFQLPADDMVKYAQPEKKKTKRFDTHKIDTELFRKLQRHKNKQKTRQAHCSDPKSDGKHKHKTDDFNRGKSPSAIQTVPHRASSKKRSEVQTDNCTDKRNQSDTDQSQFFFNGFQSQPIIPHKHNEIYHHQTKRKNQCLW
ncbi:MAG TPA: hypothetical protein DEB43_05475 [Desulfovibrio sp.]|nr:hypothetical protein [Desulfovibrio sp.]